MKVNSNPLQGIDPFPFLSYCVLFDFNSVVLKAFTGAPSGAALVKPRFKAI
ncbi:hypothetical protein THTE_3909 [Thermogutta terrifontis]|uniref:Uncharacterized protein n=1 Tax=Thermogutta terrifontis TaxID=1331910 RepID=A0A286RKN4_9BACT|nr:hypothetical protein THTE_3909 [Thermogutta terrifontis]